VNLSPRAWSGYFNLFASNLNNLSRGQLTLQIRLCYVGNAYKWVKGNGF
jgi:hypothetical protein